MSLLGPSLLEVGDVRAATVAVVDDAGVQLSGFDHSRPDTAALTSVPQNVASVTILAANPDRRQAIIYNAGTKTLYLAFAATATTSAYTVPVSMNTAFEVPLNGYTGVISGIWAGAGGGSAKVTEITKA